MATTPEARVKAQCRKALAAAGAFHFMPVSNGMGRMGIPDLICCLRGRFLAVEAKAGRGRPTMLQLKALREIDEAGGLALVINETNLDVLEECLRDIENARSNWRVFDRPQEDLEQS